MCWSSEHAICALAINKKGKESSVPETERAIAIAIATCYLLPFPTNLKINCFLLIPGI